MRAQREQFIKDYLMQNGIDNPGRIQGIIDGFDLDEPVYHYYLEPGEEIYQYVRTSTAEDQFITTGNWFALPGASMDALAIFGGSGRMPTKFSVIHDTVALEGTAAKYPKTWQFKKGGREVAIGGKGGATQMYIPRNLLGRLQYNGILTPGATV